MTLEDIARQTEMERLRVLDTRQKKHVLELLEKTLSAAGVHVLLAFDEARQLVIINYLASAKPKKVVNVNLDNPMAMVYDIFRVVGRDLLEEA